MFGDPEECEEIEEVMHEIWRGLIKLAIVAAIGTGLGGLAFVLV